MSNRRSIKSKHDPDKVFVNIPELDDYFQKDDAFVAALEAYSEFTESFGVLSIISYDEIINIKFNLEKDKKALQSHPLKLQKMSRIKSSLGKKLIRSQEKTYLLSKDAKVYHFKSFKAIDIVDHLAMDQVFYFESFGDTDTFVMIVEKDSRIILRIHGHELAEERSFDLMSNTDTVKALTTENDINQFASEVTFNVEFLQDKLDSDAKAEDFFCAFLSCNLKEEKIKDILLVSVNERLMWIKYSHKEESSDVDMAGEENDVQIHTKLMAKGKILAIRYWCGGLMIIDEFFQLTTFYYCTDTKIIKKSEFPLVGGVRCFRFYEEYLIFATKYKVVLMRFICPSMEPETSEVSLGLITAFTIVRDHDFLIAIDANNLFFYVPIMQSRYIYDRNDTGNFFELSRDDIIKLPESIKYLEEQEKELKKLSEEFEREMDLKIFFDHLEENDSFNGGNATVEYIPCLPKIEPHDIVCNRTNRSSSGGYLKISLAIQSILRPFSFSISAYRHSKEGAVIVREVEIAKNHQTQIYIPLEMNDNPQNELKLFINFKTEETILEFPIEIASQTVHENYQNMQNDMMKESLMEIEKLMKSNNI